MAKPMKKKSTPKKAAKKPTAGKAGAAKPKPVMKAVAKAPAPAPRAPAPRARPAPPAEEPRGTTPYAPRSIDGIGWPAFRYPPQ